MRWVLMLFVILAAVMGGEARAVVVMGREVVSERVGKEPAVERRVEDLRRASRGVAPEVEEAAGLEDGGPLECWFPGGVAVARSDGLSGTGTTGCRRVSSTAWRYDLADNRVARTETEERRVANSTSWVRTAAADQRCLYRNAAGTGPNGRNQLSQSWETRTRWDAESGAPLELSEQTVSYRYDPRGNRTRRTTRLWKQARATGSAAWPVPTVTDTDEALEWDGENRLTGMWRGPWKEELAQVPFESLVGQAVAGSTVWRWGYDHRSRRVQRDEPGSGGERLRTVTVFSGGTSAAEYTVTAAAGSAWTVPSAPTVQHVRGPDLGGGTKGLLYSLRNGLPTFNRYNGRGDVVAQSDIDGTTTWAASYQADGRRTSEAGTNVERHRANCLPKATRDAASGLVFQAAFAAGRSKEEDPTGLLNEGFRYRDMETGTFISRDPLGLVDGPNVYCYVRQNPWTMWDPEGLWAIADDAIAMGVGAVLGVAAQGVSDVWHGKLSGWEDYAASGVGGALAGEAALYTGGLASGAVYGASANLTRQGLRNLSGKQSGFDCNSLVAETAVCAVGGKLGEVAAPYLSRTVARAMQKESSVVAAGSTTALNAEVKATGDVLESTIAPAAEAGAANKPLMSSGGTWTGNTGGAGLKYNIKPAAKGAKIDVDALAKSAAEHDRKGLTRAGRAMDKHAVGQRGGTSPFPPLRGGVAEKNAMGQFQVEDMLTHPDAVFTPLGRGGLQVKLPDGRAMRFNADGRLAGFID